MEEIKHIPEEAICANKRKKKKKSFPCSVCGKIFPMMCKLKIHMKYHRGQRDFPCNYCDYKAYAKSDQIRHIATHTGEKNHICEYCGSRFALESDVNYHVKRSHQRKHYFMCEECGFSTNRTHNLKVHIAMRHRGAYNNYVCPVCGSSAKQKAAFMEHMRTHTGDRPYTCDHCKKTFVVFGKLSAHIRNVHNAPQFECSTCKKRFKTRRHLNRHEITHSKEKPYKCFLCAYSSKTRGSLTHHIKVFHQKPDYSFRKIKAEKELSGMLKVDPDWIEKGKKLTEEYLKELSSKLGKSLTVEELKVQEKQKQEDELRKMLVKCNEIEGKKNDRKQKLKNQDCKKKRNKEKEVDLKTGSGNTAAKTKSTRTKHSKTREKKASKRKTKLSSVDVPHSTYYNTKQGFEETEIIESQDQDIYKLIPIQTQENEKKFILCSLKDMEGCPNNVQWFVPVNNSVELKNEISEENECNLPQNTKETTNVITTQEQQIEMKDHIEQGILLPPEENNNSEQNTFVLIINS